MIHEHALLSIFPARCAEFEQAFASARLVIARADGCGAVILRRSIETVGGYELIVEWPTVEHHMEGFRNSALYAEWRGLLGPFFAEAPQVQHYETVG